MATFKIALGKPRKDKTRQIYINVNHNGTRDCIKLSTDAMPRQVGKNGEIIDTKLLTSVYELLTNLQNSVLELGVAASGMSAKELVEVIWTRQNFQNRRQEFRLDWVEWLENFIVEKKKRPGRTWEGYNSAKVAFQKYMAFKGISKIDINELKKSTMLDFYEWMETNGKIGPRGREVYMTYLSAAHTAAKKKFNDDDDQEMNIPRSPFKGIDYKIPSCDKNDKKNYALSSEQVRLLWEAPVPDEKRVKRARDTFFLSFFLCGMNSCDMFDLPLNKEKYVVEYDRRKVVGRIGNSAHIRLDVPEMIRPVMDEYRGRRSFFNYQDELCDDQSMNKSVNNGLKVFIEKTIVYYAVKWSIPIDEAKERLGISKAVTYYTARHTWASIAVNECHIAMDLVDRCLCHITDSVAAKSYVKRDYTSINEANRTVIEKVFGS